MDLKTIIKDNPKEDNKEILVEKKTETSNTVEINGQKNEKKEVEELGVPETPPDMSDQINLPTSTKPLTSSPEIKYTPQNKIKGKEIEEEKSEKLNKEKIIVDDAKTPPKEKDEKVVEKNLKTPSPQKKKKIIPVSSSKKRTKESLGEGFYEVDVILKRKIVEDEKGKKSPLYLVKWKNFGLNKSSWEPPENFRDDSRDLLEDLDKKRKEGTMFDMVEEAFDQFDFRGGLTLALIKEYIFSRFDVTENDEFKDKLTNCLKTLVKENYLSLTKGKYRKVTKKGGKSSVDDDEVVSEISEKDDDDDEYSVSSSSKKKTKKKKTPTKKKTKKNTPRKSTRLEKKKKKKESEKSNGEEENMEVEEKVEKNKEVNNTEKSEKSGGESKSYIWQYMDEDWKNYDEEASKYVEEAYHEWIKNPGDFDVRSVKSGKYKYMVDFRQMSQMNIEHENHTTRKIRRHKIT